MKKDDLGKKYDINPENNIPREVYGIPDPEQALINSHILFAFSNKPSFGRFGGDGGCEITVFKNGYSTIELFEFGNPASISKETNRMLPKEMRQIIDLISKNKTMIEEMDEKYIYCCDGNVYKFTFNNKTIIADNGFDENHFIWKLTNTILEIVYDSHRRYEVNPEKNIPQIVYGPPPIIDSIEQIEPIMPIEPVEHVKPIEPTQVPDPPMSPERIARLQRMLSSPNPPLLNTNAHGKSQSMIGYVEIEYEISGLGRHEHTTISGMRANSEFNFGNNSYAVVKIIAITQDTIVLEFSKLDKHVSLPNNEKRVILREGETIRLRTDITPSKSFTLKIVRIWHDLPKFYK